MNWIRKIFEVPHTTHKTIISMEGIRGFAVSLVFLVHYVTLIEPWLLGESLTFRLATYIRSIGTVGVDLFFVLSGFLIYGMLIKKHRPFKSYILRRIQRIYPTFSVVFIIYLCLSVLFPAESKIPAEWKDGVIFIIQNFLLMPGLFDITAIITVAWSLSYEFFYYLFIPFLITILSMRSWKAHYRVIFFVVVSLLFFVFFAFYNGPIRLLMFVSGVLLYETIENKYIRSMPPIGLPALLTAIVSIVVLKNFGVDEQWKYGVLYVLFYLFCLECFLTSGFTTRCFSCSPLRWIGNISYSFYLIHSLSLKLFFMILEEIYPAQQGDIVMFWVLILPVFVLSLIPSVVLFIYIEKPYSLVQK